MVYLISTYKEIFPQYNYASISDALDYLTELEWVSVDTETKGFDVYTKKLLTIQLGNKHNQFIIDVSCIDIQHFKTILETKNLILQNAKFDIRFLFKNGIIPKGKIWDTLLAEHKLTQGLIDVHRNLGVLAQKYADATDVDKSNRGLIHLKGLYDPIVIQYCAKDIEYLEEIMTKQIAAAVSLNMLPAIELENEVVKAVAYMEFCGIHLDTTKWIEKVKKTQDKYEAAVANLDKYIIDSNMTQYIDQQLNLFSTEKQVLINWASDIQVKKLFKQLGINVTVVEKGITKDSIEAPVLEPQKKQFPILPLYLEYAKLAKEISTYGMAFLRHINPVTKRIHTNFNQIVSTGRMSSGGKQGEDETVNLQNIPAEYDTRACFTPQLDNNLFVDCDYSGMENVVMTNISQDPSLIEFFNSESADLHSFVAKKIFYRELEGIPEENVKASRPDLRSKAKSGGFCFLFGGTGFTVATQLNIPKSEGEALEQAYFEAFPGLKTYFDKVEKEALDRGYILIDSITGSKRFILNYDAFSHVHDAMNNLSSNYWDRYREGRENNTPWYQNEKEKVSKYYRTKGKIRRNAINGPVQGTSASIAKIALLNMYNYILENNLFGIVLICNAVHDEILLECPKEIAPSIATVLKNIMEQAAVPYCKTIPLKADAIISDWWEH